MEKEKTPASETLSEEIEKTKIWFAGGYIFDCASGYTIAQHDGVWYPLGESKFVSDGN